jgi:hypothetical protein
VEHVTTNNKLTLDMSGKTMLKKLSELKYKIDNSGTVTINLGDGWILKGSPIEFLVIADKIVTLQTEKTKLQAANSIYLQTLKALEIPDHTVTEIQRRLHCELETNQTELETNQTELETNQTKETPCVKTNTNNVKSEHKMLYQFVNAYVNSENKENEFQVEEFSVFNHEIKSLPKILGQYGFDVEIKGQIIKIRLNGEK